MPNSGHGSVAGVVVEISDVIVVPGAERKCALQERSCEGEEHPGAWMIDRRVRGEVQLGLA